MIHHLIGMACFLAWFLTIVLAFLYVDTAGDDRTDPKPLFRLWRWLLVACFFVAMILTGWLVTR